MATIQATVPQGVVREVNRFIRLGLFRDESEIIRVALKKMFAEQSRDYLRDLARSVGITKKGMLNEWRKIRA